MENIAGIHPSIQSDNIKIQTGNDQRKADKINTIKLLRKKQKQMIINQENQMQEKANKRFKSFDAFNKSMVTPARN